MVPAASSGGVLMNRKLSDFVVDMRLYSYEGGSKWAAPFAVVLDRIRCAVGDVVCAINGHNWEEEGPGDAENGRIDLNCRRCGKGETKWWS